MYLTHVYLDLANMLDPHYFGLGYLLNPRTLDVAGAKSRHLGSGKHVRLRLLGSGKHA